MSLLKVRDCGKYIKVSIFGITILKISNDIISQKLLPIEQSLSELSFSVKRNFQYRQVFEYASVIHKDVFPKYRNILENKDVYIIGGGPTLDFFRPIESFVQIGVNSVVTKKNLNLDYLFVQDYRPVQFDVINQYKGNNCKKFFGIHINAPEFIIPDEIAKINNAERYCFCDYNDCDVFWSVPIDLSFFPFMSCTSVIHPAAIFALWCGARRIFLVGCDCSTSGHCSNYIINSDAVLDTKSIINEWSVYKDYVQVLSPSTQIYSINPVGLKGLFSDVYTLEYLKKRKVNEEKIYILKDNGEISDLHKNMLKREQISKLKN